VDENIEEISSLLTEVAAVLLALAGVLRATTDAVSGTEEGASGEVSPDAPASFAVDWQVPPAVKSTSLQDGEKKFDKVFRKNPARARYLAKRRAERFRARFGGESPDPPSTPIG
jgi:hypothetical protein